MFIQASVDSENSEVRDKKRRRPKKADRPGKPLPLLVRILMVPVRFITHTALRLWTLTMYRPKPYFDYPSKSRHKLAAQPAVVISNHLAGSDGGLVMIYFYRNRFTAVVAREWYNKMSFLIGPRIGVPVDRYRGGVYWLREAVERTRKGRSILIFPEGFVEKEKGHVTQFHPGFIQLARETGLPVIPLFIEGYYSRVITSRFRIAIGAPMQLEAQGERTEREYFRDECLRFQHRVEELRDGMHARMELEKSKKRKKGADEARKGGEANECSAKNE